MSYFTGCIVSFVVSTVSILIFHFMLQLKEFNTSTLLQAFKDSFK